MLHCPTSVTCEVYCKEKKNKSCRGNKKNWLFVKSKCKGMVEMAKEGEWGCDVYV